jgi:autotransporter-associated beta strand protein
VTQDTLSGANGTNAATVNLSLTNVGSTGAGEQVSKLAYGTNDNRDVLLAGSSSGLWLSTTSAANSLVNLPAYVGATPTGLVFDPRSQNRFYVADFSDLYGTTDQGATIQSLTANLPAHFIRPTALDFISNNGVNALLVTGLNNQVNAQSPIVVADSDSSGTLSNWRLFGSGLPNVPIGAIAYNPAVDVLAIGTFGRGNWILYDVTSYFSQASTLQFGLANNDSVPDASFLTDGTVGQRPLLKYGTGTLTISGVATYTGATTVNGGILQVDGSIARSSGVTVNSGAALMGTGIVGNTSVAGGTFAPGSGIAGSSMTVSGTLGFNAASTYVVNVNATTASFANVSGVATLGGAGVSASFGVGSFISKKYTILNAGSISGTFAALTNTNLPASFTDRLSYDATHAYLNLILDVQLPASGSLTGNQNNVASALTNYFNANGGIPTVFAMLNGTGLSQVSGQPGASTAQSGSAAPGQFVNAVFGNAFGGGGTGGGAAALGFAGESADAPRRPISREAQNAYAAVTPRDRRTPSFEGRWSVFAAVYGGNNRVNGDAAAGTNTTTSRTYGTLAGADYRFTPDTQAGFALGGAGSSFDVDGGFGGGKADIFNAAAYARHNFGAAYVAGALSYSWQDTTTDRTVTISGTDRLHASFKAQALAARLEGGWRYATPLVGITPYGAVQSTTFFMPAYGETATSGSDQFALSYAAKTTTNIRTELGARFDKAMAAQGGVFTLTGRTAWAHDSNIDSSATATFQTLPGATFTSNGAQPSPNALLVSLGAEMAWHNGWSIAALLDGEFSRTTTGYAGNGTVRYAW